MRIACLVMQKNERALLEPWILYHGAMFGYESLYVYDNGSTAPECANVLAKYESLGVNVERSFDTKDHFEQKGHIFSEKIKALDADDPFDFYFPMDCDEFLVVERDGQVHFNASAILNELSSLVDIKQPLCISAAYDNNPLTPDFYFRSAGQRKTFFTRNTCKTLDLGFHAGCTHTSCDPVRTAIGYVHFHYKTFADYVESAKQKLLGRIEDFSETSLIEFGEKKKPGFHLVGALIAGEDEYYQSMYRKFTSHRSEFVNLEAFSAYLKVLGVGYACASELLKSFEDGTARVRGYVDFIRPEPDGFEVYGWFSSAYGAPLDEVVLIIGGQKFTSHQILRHERNDVVAAVRFADARCGYVAKFEELPDNIASETFEARGRAGGKSVAFSVSPNFLALY